MRHRVRCSRGHPLFQEDSRMSSLVRFFALHRIKPHAPPLVRAPPIPFEFHSCERIPQRDT
ncbi:hypothetical protein ZWY2020_007001 [Hordeum vulgare]|nr:hypothetical protein ZWY2020_007001 [Hordeum vulgare]